MNYGFKGPVIYYRERAGANGGRLLNFMYPKGEGH